MATTGCQRTGGSPKARSTQRATSMAPAGHARHPVQTELTTTSSIERSVLDAALRGHASVVVMLDELHLGDGVGEVDELLRCATAGGPQVDVAGTLAKHLEHFVELKPAVSQRVGDLVEHDHEVLTRQDGGGGTFPAVAGQLGRVLQVLALPAEAIAQAFDGHAQLLEHAVLAEAGRRHLHELVDPDLLATAMGAQGQAEGRGALALAIAGVDEDEAATRAIGFFDLAVNGWFFNLHHGAPCRGVGWMGIRDRAPTRLGCRHCQTAPAQAHRATVHQARPVSSQGVRASGLGGCAGCGASTQPCGGAWGAVGAGGGAIGVFSPSPTDRPRGTVPRARGAASSTPSAASCRAQSRTTSSSLGKGTARVISR